MKLHFALAAFLGVTRAQNPVQTFFIPMPEYDTYVETFQKINTYVSGDVTSMIAFAVSTKGTIIWYDHWEDGFEKDITGVLQGSTEVWGDGDCSNGSYQEAIGEACDNDYLEAGQSIVIMDTFSHSGRNSNNPTIEHDGGDKILATSPIAITRGMYPQNPGSLMAGAVEVMETAVWGMTFECPIGQDLSSRYSTSSTYGEDTEGWNAYEHVGVYVMAGEDDTTVTFKEANGVTATTQTLQQGEHYYYRVDATSETFTSTKPIQAHIVSGDTGSTYELRWYSLLPRENWAKSYISPVGDTEGETKILIYNPNSSSINVRIQKKTGYYDQSVNSKKCQYTSYIPDGTGAEVKWLSGGGSGEGSGEFLALSVTDTQGSNQIYDWGFPLMPTDMLTSQVLIGWGYGCTGNSCTCTGSFCDNGATERSVVWITPVADATIYADYDNNGTVDTMVTASRLECVKFTDGDKDMSGAVIWAVQQGAGPDSTDLVNIAAAWGQDPSKSGSSDNQALDLGTVIPPMNVVRVDEVIELKIDINNDGLINPGDTCTYTIAIQNYGQRDYLSGDYKICKPSILQNLPRQVYVADTCSISDGEIEQPCNDVDLTSDGCFVSPYTLIKRGGKHFLSFDIVVKPVQDIDDTVISDQGTLKQTGLGPELPFSVPAPIYLTPDIEIQKTVHKGIKNTCSTGEELVTGLENDVVTYCLEIKNIGLSYLKNVKVTDPNGMPQTTLNSGGVVAPGESQFVNYQSSIPNGGQSTDATVVGDPCLVNGNNIPTYDGGQVSDADDAGVNEGIPPPNAGIKISKTVHLGTLVTCFNGQELEYGPQGQKVTYCYEVSNTGDAPLTVVVTDPEGSFTSSPINLGVGENKFVNPNECTITGDVTTDGLATGTPSGGAPVTDTDPAGVKKIEPNGPCVA